MRPMPRWAIFIVGMYAGAAVVTLGFQTYVRLDHCSGYRACAVSLAKGAMWSYASGEGRLAEVSCLAKS
jgi:hypothetical protein